MNAEEALKYFERLIETTMANGAIKNFATLDKLREAVTVLKNVIDGNKEKS